MSAGTNRNGSTTFRLMTYGCNVLAAQPLGLHGHPVGSAARRPRVAGYLRSLGLTAQPFFAHPLGERHLEVTFDCSVPDLRVICLGHHTSCHSLRGLSRIEHWLCPLHEKSFTRHPERGMDVRNQVQRARDSDRRSQGRICRQVPCPLLLRKRRVFG